LGHNLSPEDQAQIGPVDILLVPVGGNFTIDAGIAADLCRKIAPSVAIPMHYRNEKCQDFPVAGVEDFLKLMKNVIRSDVSETTFEKDSLPEATQVIVLRPAL
jgi:L-ascorbate metabolism protein UlaG (beta-lactamase superfamily)